MIDLKTILQMLWRGGHSMTHCNMYGVKRNMDKTGADTFGAFHPRTTFQNLQPPELPGVYSLTDKQKRKRQQEP